MNVDETKLNKFLSLDWENIEQTLKEINEGLAILEQIAKTCESLDLTIAAMYEEQHTKPDAHLDDFLEDIEETTYQREVKNND